jgi:OOP family OmpA-OmpF porin
VFSAAIPNQYKELHMKRTLIACALVAGMAMANTAMAQDYDDRFYITVGGGYGMFDNARNVNNEFYGTLGFGKFITPNVSLDAELWHSNPELDYDLEEERNWELMSVSLVGRLHFGEADRWRPYLALGLGGQKHRDGSQRQPLALGFNESRTGTNLLGIVGLGVQGALGRGALRAEIGARFDMDDGEYDDFDDDLEDIFQPDDDDTDAFTDTYVGLSYVLPLGARTERVQVVETVAAAPVKTCADLDDDGDGVNNCDDKCPGSAAGTAVGADGCPVPVVEPEPVMEPKPFRG